MRKAFTLAEVLITLGILGVVAALTIPNLITKYQKQEFATLLKENFNIIEQAILLTQTEIEDPNWVDDLNKTKFSDVSMNKIVPETAEKYIFPHLKIVKNYGYIVPSLNSYNFPKYKTYSGEQVAPTSPTGSTFYTTKIANGSYIFYSIGTSSGGTYYYPYLYVDINGDKKPNIVGKDVFIFVITSKGRLAMPGISKSREELKSICKKNPSEVFLWQSCGALIQKDGWQIKEDYPW